MFGITRVPSTVYLFLSRFKQHFHCAQGRHFLLCCWIVTGLLLDTGTGRMKRVIACLPKRVRYWSALRLLRSGQWDVSGLIHDAATATVAELPPPKDRTCYLVVDPTLKRKRGPKHPLARKRRLNKASPFVFGFEVVVVIASFGPYRVPVCAAVVDPAIPGHANKLIRQAIAEFVRPAWAKRVVVVGAAIVTGVQLSKTRDAGGQEEMTATSFSDVFIRRAGRWLLALTLATDLAEIPPQYRVAG